MEQIQNEFQGKTILVTGGTGSIGSRIVELLLPLPAFCADIPPLRELGLDDAVYFSPDADPAKVAGSIADYFDSSLPARLAMRVRSSYRWESIYEKQIKPLLISTFVRGLSPLTSNQRGEI